MVSIKKKESLGPKVKKLKDGTLRFFFSGFNADVKKNGKVRFGRKSPGFIEGNPIHPRGAYQKRVVGAFAPGTVGGDVPWLPGAGFTMGSGGDLTEAIMRAKGQDPYAADKLRFLKRSRRWRLSLKRRALKKQSQIYLSKLPGRLLRLWNDPGRSVEEKRQLLFELWDECLEPSKGLERGRGWGKEAMRAAKAKAKWAGQARTIIISFIQKNLPRGSGKGFTPEELRRFKTHRKGKVPFRPYGDPR